MIRFYASVLLVLAAHLLLVYNGLIPGNLKLTGILDGAIGLIFALSVAITQAGIKGDPESFVWRFLIMTTFQLLASLTVILVLVFKQKANALVIGINGTAVALLLLVLQSIVLLKEVKKR